MRFGDGIRAPRAEDVEQFLEIGPKATLLGLVPANAGDAGDARVSLLPSLRSGRGEAEAMLEALGALYVQGQAVDAARVFPDRSPSVPLPGYPWQRERYWIDAPEQSASERSRGHLGGHPLLGLPTQLSTQTGTWIWEAPLDAERLPWLADHRIQGATIFPAAGYVEMAFAAGAELAPGVPIAVTDVEITQVLALPETGNVLVQVVATEQGAGSWSVQVASRVADGGETTTWSVHARAGVRRVEAGLTAAPADLASWRHRLGEPIDTAGLYASFATAGLEYGSSVPGHPRAAAARNRSDRLHQPRGR